MIVEESEQMKGVKYISLYEPNGYGEAARRYLLGLENANVNFTWTPMIPGMAWKLGYEPFENGDVGDPCLQPFCNKQIDYDTVVVHMVPEYYTPNG